MNSEREYGLIRPFDIDHGQLDGLRPNECFVLGYECALVDESLKLSDAFERAIHAENTDRIDSECRRSGRRYSIRWMEGDVSESWKWLKVEATE